MFDVLCDLFFALGVWKTWIGLIISVYLIFHANTVIRRAMFRLSAKAWPKCAVIAKYSSAILKSEDMHRSLIRMARTVRFFFILNISISDYNFSISAP